MNVSDEFDVFESNEDFIFVDSAIHEFDAVGESPLRKGESGFQWSAIETACLRLLAQAKDIRVAIWLIRAGLHRTDLGNLCNACSLLAEYMRAPAAEIRPFAPSDETPEALHAIHLSWLATPQFRHQLDRMYLAEIGGTLGDLVRNRQPSTECTEDARRKVLGQLNELHAALASIATGADDRGAALDLTEVLNFSGAARAALSGPSHSQQAQAPGVAVKSPPVTAGMSATAPANRQEVAHGLSQMIEYFRIHEPSHPAPIFLVRVQRMLGANFEEILDELYAEGAVLAARIGRPGGDVN